MNNFVLSQRSIDNLKGVHPDLVRVVHRAIGITKRDFGISEGVRTLDRQKELVRTGASKTLDSKHLLQPDGFGHAVDVMVYYNGKVTWDEKYFRPVIQAMFTAAILESVPIRAGGLWSSFLDCPHFELDESFYPK